MVGVMACWKPKVHRAEYGSFTCGFRKMMFCPTKVASPADEPAGCVIPVGKGFTSVTAGESPLLLVLLEGSEVVWLKPCCSRIGLVEYAPLMVSWLMLNGCTNIPKPPRITVLPFSKSGDQAN